MKKEKRGLAVEIEALKTLVLSLASTLDDKGISTGSDFLICVADCYAPLRVYMGGIEFHPDFTGPKKVGYEKSYSYKDLGEALPQIFKGISSMREAIKNDEAFVPQMVATLAAYREAAI